MEQIYLEGHNKNVSKTFGLIRMKKSNGSGKFNQIIYVSEDGCEAVATFENCKNYSNHSGLIGYEPAHL